MIADELNQPIRVDRAHASAFTRVPERAPRVGQGQVVERSGDGLVQVELLANVGQPATHASLREIQEVRDQRVGARAVERAMRSSVRCWLGEVPLARSAVAI